MPYLGRVGGDSEVDRSRDAGRLALGNRERDSLGMSGPVRSRAEEPRAPRAVSVRSFVLHFVLGFALLEAFVYLVLWKARVFEPYAELNARLTAALLRPFLDGVQAHGPYLTAQAFSLVVRPGCDSYQASAVLLAGILAFPAPIGRKLVGAAIGLASLLVLNLARLAALLLAGLHDRALFERMHLEILPAVLVLAALFLLLSWALWSRVSPARPGGTA